MTTRRLKSSPPLSRRSLHVSFIIRSNKPSRQTYEFFFIVRFSQFNSILGCLSSTKVQIRSRLSPTDKGFARPRRPFQAFLRHPSVLFVVSLWSMGSLTCRLVCRQISSSTGVHVASPLSAAVEPNFCPILGSVCTSLDRFFSNRNGCD